MMTTAINIERDDIMDIVGAKYPPLIDILSEIPDLRKAKGKRHPLPAILALTCVATMCGYKGYRAFAEWGRNYGKDMMKALGFTHEKGPCAATFSNVFRWISDELSDYSDWPGLQQVFQLTRTTTFKKTGKIRQDTVYGINRLTSLTPQQADAARLMNLVRCHWHKQHIENKSHWIRDVTFGEDNSQVRCGNAPQVMAAFRNTAIGLARSAGKTNIAAACREFAAKPTVAVELIGIRI